MNSLVKTIKENPDALFGKGVTSDEIAVAEAKLGLSFADEYKAYLEELAVVSVDGSEFTGLTPVDRVNVVKVTAHQRELTPDVPSDWYVLEVANIDGIVIWQSSSGAVYQTAPGLATEKIADSFADYISNN